MGTSAAPRCWLKMRAHAKRFGGTGLVLIRIINSLPPFPYEVDDEEKIVIKLKPQAPLWRLPPASQLPRPQTRDRFEPTCTPQMSSSKTTQAPLHSGLAPEGHVGRVECMPVRRSRSCIDAPAGPWHCKGQVSQWRSSVGSSAASEVSLGSSGAFYARGACTAKVSVPIFSAPPGSPDKQRWFPDFEEIDAISVAWRD